MRISDWSSDVCSSDRVRDATWRTGGHDPDEHPDLSPSWDDHRRVALQQYGSHAARRSERRYALWCEHHFRIRQQASAERARAGPCPRSRELRGSGRIASTARSEEHTSELQSLMRISYAVFCLKKKKI